MKNKSYLEDVQLTRGPDLRNRDFARSRFFLSLLLPPPPSFVLEPPKRDLGTRSLTPGRKSSLSGSSTLGSRPVDGVGKAQIRGRRVGERVVRERMEGGGGILYGTYCKTSLSIFPCPKLFPQTDTKHDSTLLKIFNILFIYFFNIPLDTSQGTQFPFVSNPFGRTATL